MRYGLYAVSVAAAVPVLLVLVGLGSAPPANPPVVREHSIEAVTTVPPRVRALLGRACFDCHSSETRWPWYAHLPVVSHLIRSDVEHGRAAMNFSEWSTGAGRTPALAAGMLAAACAAVEQHLMPKPPYPYFHPEARLSPDDVKLFCSWTREQGDQLRAAARRHRAGEPESDR